MAWSISVAVRSCGGCFGLFIFLFFILINEEPNFQQILDYSLGLDFVLIKQTIYARSSNRKMLDKILNNGKVQHI